VLCFVISAVELCKVQSPLQEFSYNVVMLALNVTCFLPGSFTVHTICLYGTLLLRKKRLSLSLFRNFQKRPNPAKMLNTHGHPIWILRRIQVI